MNDDSQGRISEKSMSSESSSSTTVMVVVSRVVTGGDTFGCGVVNVVFSSLHNLKSRSKEASINRETNRVIMRVTNRETNCVTKPHNIKSVTWGRFENSGLSKERLKSIANSEQPLLVVQKLMKFCV
jgi:hypothetical protein